MAAARRIALMAQGLTGPRPNGPVTTRQLQSVIDRLGVIQVDSVNVLARAHYVPFFSRLGPYDTTLLDRAINVAPRRLFEYWAHAACLIDTRLWSALQWRMQEQTSHPWHSLQQLEERSPGVLERVYEAVAAAPQPITPREFKDQGLKRRDHWGWNWSDAKIAFESLHTMGRLVAAGRNAQFERAFHLPERVLPPTIAAAEPLERAEAHVVLIERAARALGIGSERCFANYFSTSRAETRAAIAALEAQRTLVPVEVAGWRGPLWRHAAAVRPRTIHARALVSPFDSFAFERHRLETLFATVYRIEIYVPEPQRRWGYYVYLFLLDDQVAARVDLKADRCVGTLRVQSAWREPSTTLDDTYIATELAAELADLATWLTLREIAVAGRGDLATALAARL